MWFSPVQTDKFLSKESLNVHKKEHSSLQCADRGKTFWTSKQVKDHRLNFHGNITVKTCKIEEKKTIFNQG